MTDAKLDPRLYQKAEPALPAFDESVRCPKHPREGSMPGFGLMGGGYGPWTCCPKCFKMLSKTFLSDEES